MVSPRRLAVADVGRRPLTGPFGEEAIPLIDLLRGTDTDSWLVITVEPNTFSAELLDNGPT